MWFGIRHRSHYNETITLTNLFKNLQEQVAAVRGRQPGLAMVTTASEKVEYSWRNNASVPSAWFKCKMGLGSHRGKI
jgi:hypothetical protein